MTCIAVRNGIIAADSRVTVSTESGGERMFKCYKLFRKDGNLIALAGESSPGMVFLDWYGTGKKPPSSLIDGNADFTALVLKKNGLFEFDAWCRYETIIERAYAVGSGAKVALGAMHMGATAYQAVEAAIAYDPGCGYPIVWASIEESGEDGPILPAA